MNSAYLTHWSLAEFTTPFKNQSAIESTNKLPATFSAAIVRAEKSDEHTYNTDRQLNDMKRKKKRKEKMYAVLYGEL